MSLDSCPLTRKRKASIALWAHKYITLTWYTSVSLWSRSYWPWAFLRNSASIPLPPRCRFKTQQRTGQWLLQDLPYVQCTMRMKRLKHMFVGCQCQIWQHIYWMVSKQLSVRKISSVHEYLSFFSSWSSPFWWETKEVKVAEGAAWQDCTVLSQSSQADGRPASGLCWEMQFCFSSSWPFPQAYDVIKKRNQRLLTKKFGNSLSCTLLEQLYHSHLLYLNTWHLKYIPF